MEYWIQINFVDLNFKFDATKKIEICLFYEYVEYN